MTQHDISQKENPSIAAIADIIKIMLSGRKTKLRRPVLTRNLISEERVSVFCL